MAPDQLRVNVRWGIKHGLLFSGALGLVVAIALGFQSQVEIQGRSVELWRIVAGYLSGGILGGTLLGMFRGYVRRRAGAFIAGSIIGTVVYLSMGFALSGPKAMHITSILLSQIPGVFVGGIAGFITVRKAPKRTGGAAE